MSDVRPDETLADGKFLEALTLHQQSRLHEARSAYREVLERQPRHLQALTYLSVIAFQDNEFQRALDLSQRALEIEPMNAAVHLLRGHASIQLEQLDAAIASYDLAIALKPDLADAYAHRGDAQSRLGRSAAALASYDKALELKSGSPQIHNNRGNALRALGRYEAAVGSYEKAIAAMPGLAEPYFNRGLALHQLKHREAAVASFEQAIAIAPGHAEAQFARANVLKDLQRLDDALAGYDRAISLNRDHVLAYCNRGNLLSELECFDEALASYDAALSLNPAHVDAHCNRGNLLGDIGRYPEALQSLDRAVRIDPRHAQARFSRAFVHFVLGDLENGWRDFEWRWKNEHCATSRELRYFSQPLWLGAEPLRGTTLLVHCEQGLGDTIQFCRYVTLAAERGARVIFEVPQSLHRLLSSLQGVRQCVARGDQLPPFDYHCPLMSLPLAFNTTLATIPARNPYLRAGSESRLRWQHRLGARTKPRVGLVWSGGFRADQPELWSVNKRRNIPLARLAPLKHPGIDFFSLQKGQPAEGELAALIARNWDGPGIADHMHEVRDFEDTAALIEQLDLVISVDTSTAHLAAALGKPVWILNRFDTCWRWLTTRKDSPWYPTVTLYRQQGRGDWEGVVQALRRDLEGLASASGKRP